MEHFKELEKKVEEILEAMILAKGYEDLIEDLYYEFCEWVYAETNAQIRKEYGANYANKKIQFLPYSDYINTLHNLENDFKNNSLKFDSTKSYNRFIPFITTQLKAEI